MLRERAKIIASVVLIADLCAVVAAFVGANLLRNAIYGALRGRLDILTHVSLLALALPIFVISFNYAGLYESFRLRSLTDEVSRTARSSLFATITLVVLIFLLKFEAVSRALLVLFGILSCLLVSTQRMAIRIFARSIRERGYNYRNIIVAGSGERAREIAESVRENSYWGLRFVGQISDNGASLEPADVPVLGNLEDFEAIVQGRAVDGVMFAVPTERLGRIRNAFNYCRQVGIPTYIYALPFEDLPSQVALENLGGIKLLTFPTVRHTDLQIFFKRVFDVVVSITLLVLFAPLMLMAAILIKLTSPGPLLFRQIRVGMNGRHFACCKFRTMIPEAEKLKGQLADRNEMDGPVFKIRNDPRTTSIGRFLRKTSLDELPQLFNVLRGHMSIVGPRPPLPEEVEKYECWQRRRLSVRPGLTCLWQVSGRNRVDFRTWMSLDMQYIDNWSWTLDLKIMLMTIPAMFKGH